MDPFIASRVAAELNARHEEGDGLMTDPRKHDSQENRLRALGIIVIAGVGVMMVVLTWLIYG
jgi:hypothetical protein